MKWIWAILVILVLYACRENSVQQGPRPRLYPIDSVPKDISNPYASIDISPMDMAYLPADYAKIPSKNNLPVARIIYSRPHMQGRKIFGNLIKYGEPWRLGANEATEIEVFRRISIQGKTVNPGRYILYCIPFPDKWTIVFNKNLYSWGLDQDSTSDVHRFDASVFRLENYKVEYFSMIFRETKRGEANLIMAWDDVEGRLPMEYTP